MKLWCVLLTGLVEQSPSLPGDKLPLSCVVCLKGSFPARYYVQNTSRDSCCLDSNYQAFLLVDDGSVGRRGGEAAFRAGLEDYISHQRTGIWGETETHTVCQQQLLSNLDFCC